MFVHLAFASQLPAIRRAGIRRTRPAHGDFPGGVFAVPVTPNHFVTHQWVRELRRRNAGPIAGVYFRVPDSERVWIGRYNEPHEWKMAAEAGAAVTAEPDARGWEVVVPRRIERAEIHRVRPLPQLIGWRYFPDSHRKKPCGCDYCQRGQYGAARLRAAFGQR